MPIPKHNQKEAMIQYLKIITTAILLAGYASTANSAVQSQAIEYKDGDVKLTGHLYWDDAITGKRPGVLVVHEWWGLNDYAKSRAEQLAALGYVAFALDMYGDNKVTTHPKEAKEWSSATAGNRDAWRQRAMLGLDQLANNALVDTDRLAAIGYCFGGATVMQMAYASADLKGVVSFHGSLPTPGEGEAANVKGRVLVEHGNADAFIPAERISQFKAALESGGVDLIFNGHDGARHGFTNPDAGKFGIENLKYDAKADESSWSSMQALFKEIF